MPTFILYCYALLGDTEAKKIWWQEPSPLRARDESPGSTDWPDPPGAPNRGGWEIKIWWWARMWEHIKRLHPSTQSCPSRRKREHPTRSCLGFNLVRAKQLIITPDEYPWRRARESQIILWFQLSITQPVLSSLIILAAPNTTEMSPWSSPLLFDGVRSWGQEEEKRDAGVPPTNLIVTCRGWD